MSELRNRLVKNFYFSQQIFLKTPLDSIQNLVRLFLPEANRHRPEKAELKKVEQRFYDLLAKDLENVSKGYYPENLLFRIPFYKYLCQLPSLALEYLKMHRMLRNNNYKKLPDIDMTEYPDYYQRNFHWQSDGYFSNKSAELYNVSVELLFWGAADIMRRQVIPPISRFLEGKKPSELRLLDLACGTGNTLRQIALSHPDLKLCALDLSPYYIEYAKKELKEFPGIEFYVANAENLPFSDNSLDIISSVYLFHELPGKARKKVLSEIYRVLKPGSLLVIEDSIQMSESPELENIMLRFAREYHEPYYKGYIREDLENLLQENGFSEVKTERHFVSKIVFALKK